MTEVFTPGEIAIFVSDGTGRHKHTGQECEIVRWYRGPLIRLPGYSPSHIEDGFIVLFQDDPNHYGVERAWLRKKRPPRSDLAKVSWKTCPWRPAKVLS